MTERERERGKRGGPDQFSVILVLKIPVLVDTLYVIFENGDKKIATRVEKENRYSFVLSEFANAGKIFN